MTAEPSANDRELPQPSKFWTVPEANQRLDSLGDLLAQLKSWVIRLRKVHEEQKRLSEFWGKEVSSNDNPDRELKARLDLEWQNLTQRLEEAISGLQSEGIEVKDLETGLIDFYSLQDGEVVFLCWLRGEPEVGFYHTLDGGYRTRRPLSDRSHRPAPSAHGRL